MRGTAVLALALLTACASSNPAPAHTTRATETIRVVGGSGALTLTTTGTSTASVGTIQSPIDRVWAVLPAAFDAVGIPVGSVDAKTHSIGNEGFKARRRLGSTSLSRYFDCGSTQGGASAETYELNVAVFTQLLPDTSGSTTFSTTVTAVARPVSLAVDYVRCTTLMRLEQKLFEEVKARLRT
jgi:hypothetical protein